MSSVSSQPTPSLPWYREITKEQWRVLFATWAVWALDAADYLIITFVLVDIAAEFKVSLDKTSLLLLAGFAVRWLGGLLFGSLSDRIGRKIPLLICLLWFTAGAGFTGLAWNFTSIAVIRILLGFGTAPGFSIGATMVAETWPERHRALGIGILDSGWGIGAIAASLIYRFVYPHFGWRAMFFVGIIPAMLLAVFIILRVPESPIWQQTRKLAKTTQENPIKALFKYHRGRVAFLAVLMMVLFFGSWPYQGLMPTYLKSIGLSVESVSWIATVGAIGQIAGFFVSGVIAETFGRRRGLAAMIFIGASFVIMLVAVAHNLVSAEVSAFLAAFFLVGSSGIWGTILTENLPAHVRASGVGFLYNLGAIGGGIAPFVVLNSLEIIHINLAQGISLFTAVAALVGLGLLYFVEETKGKSLNVANEPSVGQTPVSH